MTKTPDHIRFEAQIAKVTTLADGGIRITLDLPETAIDAAKEVLELKQHSPIVLIAIVPTMPTVATPTHPGVEVGYDIG